VTARAEALFNKARLAQKYCGGGKVSVTVGTLKGAGVLSDIDRQDELASGGFIQGIEAELMLRKCEFETAPAIGSTLTANSTIYRVMGVNNDHRMQEWVLTLQAQNR
jgi:hypothetical protein